jgi:5-oxoprolinase (ATP-hydrolysing)
MTNTRITDPEVLEHRYPVHLARFSIREGSGGGGRHRGGCGVVREYVFERPLALSVLTQHRRQGPYGLAGGEPGQAGGQRVVRRDGTAIALEAADGCSVDAGDRLILLTPGGGGWGENGPDEVRNGE